MTFIWDLWPQTTLCDFATIISGNLTSRAWFWYLIYLISKKFKIWPILGFLTTGDLWWPRNPFFDKLTSRASFKYTIYPLSINLKIWPIFGVSDLGWPRDPFVRKADVKSVILIYNLYKLIYNWYTMNFEIWP